MTQEAPKRPQSGTEVESILAWAGAIEEKAKDWQIPAVVDLLDIGKGLVIGKPVMVERDGRASRENWLFVQQVEQPQTAKQTLSEKVSQTFKDLALKIGVLEDTVFDAAIKTRVLADNFKDDQPIFLQFGARPEGLRLTGSYLADLTTNTVTKIGYRLEYYSGYDTVKGNKLWSLLIHTEPKELTFPVLFPQVLVFTSHVASKKDQMRFLTPGVE